MDSFHVLGVHPQASTEEVRQAYRKAVLECHPDKGGDTTRFNAVKTAYDDIMRNKQDAGKTHDTADTLARLFMKVYDSFNKVRLRSGLNITMDLPVTMKEVYSGAIKKLCIRTFHGTLPIKKTYYIPLFNFKNKHVFKGGGDSTMDGMMGDLIVNLKEESSDLFFFDIELTGHDLHTSVKVGLRDYVMGGELLISLPDETTTSIAFSPMWKSYCTTVVVPGKGLPLDEACEERGNLIVSLHAHIVAKNDASYRDDEEFLNKLSDYFELTESPCAPSFS